MTVVRRSARVPYSAVQMFALVNDIEAYPEFLHWCRSARVIKREGAVVDAMLEVGVRGFSKSFSTRNRLSRPTQIQVTLLSGPFERLEGKWSFSDSGKGCDIDLSIDFKMKPSPFSAVFAAVFEEIARSQMSAFLERADRVYGQHT